jgi:predicted ArsR family transcriptional regulator
MAAESARRVDRPASARGWAAAREIAAALHLSPDAVRRHLQRLAVEGHVVRRLDGHEGAGATWGHSHASYEAAHVPVALGFIR